MAFVKCEEIFISPILLKKKKERKKEKKEKKITSYPVCSTQNFKTKASYCISYKRKLCIGIMSFDSNGRNLKHRVGFSVKGEADWRRNCRYMPHPQKGINLSPADLEMQIL